MAITWGGWFLGKWLWHYLHERERERGLVESRSGHQIWQARRVGGVLMKSMGVVQDRVTEKYQEWLRGVF
jgi:hypothetical protein